MKNLAIAFLTAVTLSASIYFGVAAIDLDWAKVLAAAPIAGFHHIAEALERRDGRRSLAPDRPTKIYSFTGFAISWPLLLAYGALAMFGILLGSQFLAGAIIGGIAVSMSGREPTEADFASLIGPAIVLVAYPLTLLGGYIIGRWIGTRSARNGMAVVLMSAALAAALLSLWTYVMMEPQQIALLGIGDNLLRTLSINSIERFGLLSISGLLGFWRGHRLKLAWYMHYLLGVLPKDARESVIELAFEEARTVQVPPPPHKVPA